MVSTAFLSTFLGSYILIVSAVFILKYESFMEYAKEFAESIALRYTVALIELGLGLAVTLTNNVWQLGYKGVITVIGWMMLLEAIFHFVATEEHEIQVMESIEGEKIGMAFGVLGIVVGLYLATQGFAL